MSKEIQEQLDELKERVTDVEHRVLRQEEHRDDHVKMFGEHMAKEEKAFDNFYKALRGQGDTLRAELKALSEHVTVTVMKGMEDRAELKELMEEKYVSKESAKLSWFVAAAVAGVVLWITSVNTTTTVNENHNNSMAHAVKQLTAEIQSHNNSDHKAEPNQ